MNEETKKNIAYLENNYRPLSELSKEVPWNKKGFRYFSRYLWHLRRIHKAKIPTVRQRHIKGMNEWALNGEQWAYEQLDKDLGLK